MPLAETTAPTTMPSIITLAVYGHGTDLVNREFRDPSVRILSIPGNTGSNAISGPDALMIFFDIYDNASKKYQVTLRDTRRTKKQLDTEFPTKNNCKIMPPLKYDPTTNTFSKQSTYDFMKENLTQGEFVNEYRRSAMHATTAEKFKNKMSQYTRDSIIRDIQYSGTHKIYTPVINRVWFFNSEARRKEIIKERKERDKRRGHKTMAADAEEAFGIFVVDTCNYQGKVKIGDNMTDKQSYNTQLLALLKKEEQLDTMNGRTLSLVDGHLLLSTFVDFLHETLGFDVINIIDNGCRACTIRDVKIQKQIIDMENEASKEINKEL